MFIVHTQTYPDKCVTLRPLRLFDFTLKGSGGRGDLNCVCVCVCLCVVMRGWRQPFNPALILRGETALRSRKSSDARVRNVAELILWQCELVWDSYETAGDVQFKVLGLCDNAVFNLLYLIILLWMTMGNLNKSIYNNVSVTLTSN